MQQFKRAGRILPLSIAMLLMAALIGCSLFRQQPATTLQGNNAVKLPQGASTPYSGWLIQDEALARILEQAEKCQAQTPPAK